MGTNAIGSQSCRDSQKTCSEVAVRVVGGSSTLTESQHHRCEGDPAQGGSREGYQNHVGINAAAQGHGSKGEAVRSSALGVDARVMGGQGHLKSVSGRGSKA